MCEICFWREGFVKHICHGFLHRHTFLRYASSCTYLWEMCEICFWRDGCFKHIWHGFLHRHTVFRYTSWLHIFPTCVRCVSSYTEILNIHIYFFMDMYFFMDGSWRRCILQVVRAAKYHSVMTESNSPANALSLVFTGRKGFLTPHQVICSFSHVRKTPPIMRISTTRHTAISYWLLQYEMPGWQSATLEHAAGS